MLTSLKKFADKFLSRLNGKELSSQESIEYNADLEKIYLFERLGICRELAKTLCVTLKNNDLSQYVDEADNDRVLKVREVQYQFVVLAEMISAAMEHTKSPSNEALTATLEWCKEESAQA
ncbi:hypothetical protein [Comamonas sp. 17RB]|uniref:hypothetical protein n=1 Tax=Comamonas sp. 17RB TaxID=3047025 RepID=UPI0024B808A9|nr:hypothetical protein [Comamonas sp. 17RB]MDI9855210.1 hypothetical protein [Comamonas sp. 17RB]